MKKHMAIIAAMILALSFTACSKGENGTPQNSQVSTEENKNTSAENSKAENEKKAALSLKKSRLPSPRHWETDTCATRRFRRMSWCCPVSGGWIFHRSTNMW